MENFQIKPRVGHGRKTAVVFSSANAVSFTYYKTFSKYEDLRVVFIRDPNLITWYNSGIGPDAPSWEALMDRLSKVLNDSDFSDVSFWGSSMGGYAALRSALHFEGSTCYSFSPQTILDPRLPHNIKSSLSSCADGDISEIKKKESSINVICGGADLVDMFHIYAGGLSEEMFFPINGGDHLVSAKLHKKGFFDLCMNSWQNGISKISAEMLEDMGFGIDRKYSDSVFHKLVHDLVRAYYFESNYDVSLSLIRDLKNYGDNAGVLMLEGHILAVGGGYDAAINSFEKAFNSSMSKLEPAKQLGGLLLKAKKIDLAISYLETALGARLNDFDCLCRLAECFLLKGESDRAMSLLRDACLVRPNSKRPVQIAQKYSIDF